MSRTSLTPTVLLLLAAPLLAAGDGERISSWTAPPFWTPPSHYEVQERAFGRDPLAADPLTIEALPSAPMPFVAITPCRLADTRGNGFTGSYGPPALVAGSPRSFPITGQCGIPSGAGAVSFNVTVTGTLGAGMILAYPTGGSAPTVSTLNYVLGQTVANAAIVPLSAGGAATFLAGVRGTQLILDVNGYYAPVNLVNTVNTLTGDVTLAQGTNVTITPSGNTLTIASTGSSAVSSVFGRTGAVTATSGDYTATLVTNTPAGTIASTTVQAAVNELDTEKSATSHTHTGSGITGLTTGGITFGSATGTLTQSPNLTWIDGALTFAVAGSVDASGLLRLGSTSATGGQLLINGTPFLHSYGSNDAFLGEGAGNLTTTGNSNTGVGYRALYAVSVGAENTAAGRGALVSNTAASRNTAVGAYAMQTQSFANAGTAWDTENTAVGYGALQQNQPTSATDGLQNTAVGAFALQVNATGSKNVAVGRGALAASTIAGENVAVGAFALQANTTGEKNTAVGYGALQLQSYSNGGSTYDSFNTAVGYLALYANQPVSTSAGYGNTALGASALASNTTGNRSVALAARGISQCSEPKIRLEVKVLSTGDEASVGGVCGMRARRRRESCDQETT